MFSWGVFFTGLFFLSLVWGRREGKDGNGLDLAVGNVERERERGYKKLMADIELAR